MKSAVIIPARMASQRFPNKPMAKIDGIPMIERVWRQGMDSKIGDVFVACCEKEVFDLISSRGGKAIMTNPNHPSGTDRIFEAFSSLENKDEYESIINLQGDMPFIKENYIKALREKLLIYEMSTLACPFKDLEEASNKSKVKVEIEEGEETIANDFYREIKSNKKINKNIFHHIGVYGYQKDFLKKFISLPPTTREQEEKLEQLRIIDKVKISVVHIEKEILGVDTKEDLDTVNQQIQNHV